MPRSRSRQPDGQVAGLKSVYNCLGGGEDATAVWARGGIGRREGLRILWSDPCRTIRLEFDESSPLILAPKF
jgi:hypothetical protein